MLLPTDHLEVVDQIVVHLLAAASLAGLLYMVGVYLYFRRQERRGR